MNIDEREIWVEKYRPKTIDEMILPDKYRNDFKRIVERQDLPHLLFSGPPGGGKTTIARILCSKHGVIFKPRDNLLFVNGSSKKQRSIAFVDEIIDAFLSHPPVKDRYKVVLVDEADNMSPDAYRSLRGLIEKYQITYGRFIFTCNYPSNIPDPLRSRFIHYKFQQIPKDFVVEHVKKILDNEKIEYEDKSVNFVVDNLYPDVRKIVQVVRQNTYGGKLDVGEDDVRTNERLILTNVFEIISFVEKGQFQKVGGCVDQIISILSTDEVDYRQLYTTLFYEPKIPAHAKIIVNKYTNNHNQSVVPSMHFTAMVFEMIKALKQLREVFLNGKGKH